MQVSQPETGETEWPRARTRVAGVEALYFYLLLFPDLGANVLNDRGYFGRQNWVRTFAGDWRRSARPDQSTKRRLGHYLTHTLAGQGAGFTF